MRQLKIETCRAEWDAFLIAAREGKSVNIEPITELDFAGLQLLAMMAKVSSDLGLPFTPSFQGEAAVLSSKFHFIEALNNAQGTLK